MIICTAALNAGCSRNDDHVVVDGLPYAFPRNHVANVVFPEEGMTFVRLKPPGEKFSLVRDVRADRREAETGRIIISKINFEKSDDFQELKSGRENVFCNNAPYRSCGFRIIDQGEKWSVIFSRSDMGELPRLRKHAAKLIASYRIKTSLR